MMRSYSFYLIADILDLHSVWAPSLILSYHFVVVFALSVSDVVVG